MEKFSKFHGLVAPIDRANIDTDALVPKQFMKSISRTGFGANLFDEWRYLDPGEPGMDIRQRQPNPEFPLNQDRYLGASALLTRQNFGCGSSREHAVWALHDFGIRAIVAPSFADIFYGNCFKNSILPIVLPEDVVDRMFVDVERTVGFTLDIDLAHQEIRTGLGDLFSFNVEVGRKVRLLEGLDDIAYTLQSQEQIEAYQHRRAQEEPWLFTDIVN